MYTHAQQRQFTAIWKLRVSRWTVYSVPFRSFNLTSAMIVFILLFLFCFWYYCWISGSRRDDSGLIFSRNRWPSSVDRLAWTGCKVCRSSVLSSSVGRPLSIWPHLSTIKGIIIKTNSKLLTDQKSVYYTSYNMRVYRRMGVIYLIYRKKRGQCDNVCIILL